jgi:hypothetical protein
MSSKWDDLNLTEQCKAVREMGDRISQHGVQPDIEVAQRLCEIGLTPISGEIERFKSGVVNLDQLNEAAKRIASTPPVAAPPVITDSQRNIKDAIQMANEYNSTNPLIPRTWHFYIT